MISQYEVQIKNLKDKLEEDEGISQEKSNQLDDLKLEIKGLIDQH